VELVPQSGAPGRESGPSLNGHCDAAVVPVENSVEAGHGPVWMPSGALEEIGESASLVLPCAMPARQAVHRPHQLRCSPSQALAQLQSQWLGRTLPDDLGSCPPAPRREASRLVGGSHFRRLPWPRSRRGRPATA